MASIHVTFSGETAGSTYDVEIKTQSGSAIVGSGKVKAEGGDVSYDDSHGDNYVAVANGRSSNTFYPSSSTVNIPL